MLVWRNPLGDRWISNRELGLRQSPLGDNSLKLQVESPQLGRTRQSKGAGQERHQRSRKRPSGKHRATSSTGLPTRVDWPHINGSGVRSA